MKFLKNIKSILSTILSVSISFTSLIGYAQPVLIVSGATTAIGLPVPGTMLSAGKAFTSPLIAAITIYPDNPLQFDFTIVPGDGSSRAAVLQEDAGKLMRYFLAALTVPEDDLWVNLSPDEPDRIIPVGFGQTEMGRDLLAQDYILKQLTASLMYPENEVGRRFWERVYAQVHAATAGGDMNIGADTLSRVWIVPDVAEVYEHGLTAIAGESRLKIHFKDDKFNTQDNMNTAEIIKQVLLPELEREVNEGEHFALLRQIFNASMWAAWYKMRLKETLLSQMYVDQNKTSGIDIEDKAMAQKIYQQYLDAFKKGVFDMIKEDYDPVTQDIIPRKYFSGGATAGYNAADLTPMPLSQLPQSTQANILSGVSRWQEPMVFTWQGRGETDAMSLSVGTVDLAGMSNEEKLVFYEQQLASARVAFGDFMVQLRTLRGLSASAMGQVLGVHQPRITELEKGRANLSEQFSITREQLDELKVTPGDRDQLSSRIRNVILARDRVSRQNIINKFYQSYGVDVGPAARSFGNFLVELQDAQGLTVKEFADKLTAHFSALRENYVGKKLPEGERVARFRQLIADEQQKLLFDELLLRARMERYYENRHGWILRLVRSDEAVPSMEAMRFGEELARARLSNHLSMMDVERRSGHVVKVPSLELYETGFNIPGDEETFTALVAALPLDAENMRIKWEFLRDRSRGSTSVYNQRVNRLQYVFWRAGLQFEESDVQALMAELLEDAHDATTKESVLRVGMDKGRSYAAKDQPLMNRVDWDNVSFLSSALKQQFKFRAMTDALRSVLNDELAYPNSSDKHRQFMQDIKGLLALPEPRIMMESQKVLFYEQRLDMSIVTFADFLSELRESRDLSQQQLANVLDVTQQNYSQIERGDVRISHSFMLGKSQADILRLTDNEAIALNVLSRTIILEGDKLTRHELLLEHSKAKKNEVGPAALALGRFLMQWQDKLELTRGELAQSLNIQIGSLQRYYEGELPTYEISNRIKELIQDGNDQKTFQELLLEARMERLRELRNGWLVTHMRDGNAMPSKEAFEFGERLAMARFRKQLNSEEIEDVSGGNIKYQALQQYEFGKTVAMTDDRLDALLSLLDLDSKEVRDDWLALRAIRNIGFISVDQQNLNRLRYLFWRAGIEGVDADKLLANLKDVALVSFAKLEVLRAFLADAEFADATGKLLQQDIDAENVLFDTPEIKQDMKINTMINDLRSTLNIELLHPQSSDKHLRYMRFLRDLLDLPEPKGGMPPGVPGKAGDASVSKEIGEPEVTPVFSAGIWSTQQLDDAMKKLETLLAGKLENEAREEFLKKLRSYLAMFVGRTRQSGDVILQYGIRSAALVSDPNRPNRLMDLSITVQATSSATTAIERPTLGDVHIDWSPTGEIMRVARDYGRIDIEEPLVQISTPELRSAAMEILSGVMKGVRRRTDYDVLDPLTFESVGIKREGRGTFYWNGQPLLSSEDEQLVPDIDLLAFSEDGYNLILLTDEAIVHIYSGGALVIIAPDGWQERRDQEMTMAEARKIGFTSDDFELTEGQSIVALRQDRDGIPVLVLREDLSDEIETSRYRQPRRYVMRYSGGQEHVFVVGRTDKPAYKREFGDDGVGYTLIEGDRDQLEQFAQGKNIHGYAQDWLIYFRDEPTSAFVDFVGIAAGALEVGTLDEHIEIGRMDDRVHDVVSYLLGMKEEEFLKALDKLRLESEATRKAIVARFREQVDLMDSVSPDVRSALERKVLVDGIIRAEDRAMAISDAPGKAPAAVGNDTDGYGGIDLNPQNYQIRVRRDGNGIPLPLPQQPVGQINIHGLRPVIINVVPLTQPLLQLGLDDLVPDQASTQRDALAIAGG